MVNFVNSLGNGLFMTASALYYTKFLGLTASQAALGLSVGGLVGISLGFLVGHFADRRGARGVYALTLAAQTVTMVSFLFAHELAIFVLVSACASLTQTASSAARAPLVRAHAGETPTAFRAFLRTSSNLAISIGALLGGIVIAVGTPLAYSSVVLINAASFAVCALLILRVPRVNILPRPQGSFAWSAFLDARYMGVAIGAGTMSVYLIMLTFVVPLWVAQRTHAPTWIVSVLVLINTALGVVFQVRASRGISSLATAARATRWAATALAAAFVAFSFTASVEVGVAIAVLVVGTVLLTVGELLAMAASVELSYTLAPPHAQGAYGGAFTTAQGAILAIAPTLVWALIQHTGTVGWLVLGLIMLGAAGLTSLSARSAAVAAANTLSSTAD